MFVMDLFPNVPFKDCSANALIDLYANKHIDNGAIVTEKIRDIRRLIFQI